MANRTSDFYKAVAIWLVALGASNCVSLGIGDRLVTWEEAREFTEQVQADRAYMKSELVGVQQTFQKSKIRRPILWRVSNGKATSWLLGTQHAFIKFDSLPLAIHQCLKQAALVAMEWDLDVEPPENRSVSGSDFKKAFFLPKGQQLSNLLTPKAWDEVQRRLPMFYSDSLEELTPFGVLSIYQKVMERFINVDGNDCLDCDIQREVKARSQKMLVLDDADLIAKMDLMPFTNSSHSAAEVSQLFETQPLVPLKENFELLFQVGTYYKSGDMAGIEKVLTTNQTPESYQALIGNRNRGWLGKLLPILRRGNAMVVVGAGHMTGTVSLLKLLNESGFTTVRDERCILPQS